jgi:hypothetical protein
MNDYNIRRLEIIARLCTDSFLGRIDNTNVLLSSIFKGTDIDVKLIPMDGSNIGRFYGLLKYKISGVEKSLSIHLDETEEIAVFKSM